MNVTVNSYCSGLWFHLINLISTIYKRSPNFLGFEWRRDLEVSLSLMMMNSFTLILGRGQLLFTIYKQSPNLLGFGWLIDLVIVISVSLAMSSFTLVLGRGQLLFNITCTNEVQISWFRMA